jgi:cytosine/adenosine deaminase-related metal-dependent hydrolase
MKLRNLRTIEDAFIDLVFENQPSFITPDTEILFEDAMVFPGLVNSHDHLDFNLFPQLGNRHFRNYSEWGHALHEEYRQEIEEVLKVPLALRVQWGIYKNLVCGVTSVVNHGETLTITNPLIHVRQHDQNLHSVGFEKNWKVKLNNPLKRNSFCVIHTGEGTDEAARQEIDQLIQWNFLQRDIIGVHGIAMSAEQSENFYALVWCPFSNYFIFNTTAAVENFRVPLLFGTDSTLTGSWNIWEHLRVARNTRKVSDRQLFDMVTNQARNVWKLKGYRDNRLSNDIVITKGSSENKTLRNFFETDAEDVLMVIQAGKLRLFDECLLHKLTSANKPVTNFHAVEVNGSMKYVEGNLPALMREIEKYYPNVLFPFQENIFTR